MAPDLYRSSSRRRRRHKTDSAFCVAAAAILFVVVVLPQLALAMVIYEACKYIKRVSF